MGRPGTRLGLPPISLTSKALNVMRPKEPGTMILKWLGRQQHRPNDKVHDKENIEVVHERDCHGGTTIELTT